MILRNKITYVIVLLLIGYCRTIRCKEETKTKDDLVESESENKDLSKVEIIKQIKRVNDDGSYTFGYEAEDGTFKIESRDVLGNIKGTFGFVDSDGEIKRVSYSTTNRTETATVMPVAKDRTSVIQQIPRTNRTNPTRRPPYPLQTPSPSSTVIQTIPRRLVSSLNASGYNNSSSNERLSFKNIVKSTDFDITPRHSVTTDSSSQTLRPNYIRATTPSQDEIHKYTEGQLIRPTQSESVTPRPSTRRLVVNRHPYLDEAASSTIKPITEESNYDSVRGNLLRRQLYHDNTNFNTRQHVINLQQSAGDDSTDVYSASLTTGTPRPLFTTTDRPRPFPSNTKTSDLLTPASYRPVYQKNEVRSLKPSHRVETTTEATSTEHNYVQPNQISLIQIPNIEDQQFRRKHPFHQGAVLIPVNQLNGRYVIDNSNNEANQRYVPQYVMPEQQFIRENENPRVAPIPYSIVSRSRPVQIPIEAKPVYTTKSYPVPIPNSDVQDEIDHIKPPVSTRDFQKLLNRLIVRQSQLQQINRIENSMQQTYIHPDRYRTMQPISVFVREEDNKQNNGPIQFLSREGQYINVPQQQSIMESKHYNSVDPYDSENYALAPLYRSGRRVARLFIPEAKVENKDDYLPADVREMLLLRMLQLAINPNLPLQPKEGRVMASAIRQRNEKEAVRNVEILGEEREEFKPVSRNKRYREFDEYEYY